ncbi:MAG: ABC transporter ATP-binding protein [Microbacterium sp.]
MKELFRTTRTLLPMLPAGARRYLIAYATLTALLALLDVAALGLLALVMAPMVAGSPVTLPLIGEVPPDRYVVVILIVCALISSKSIASLVMRWVATRRFASYELEIGDQLFRAYLHSPWTDRLSRNSAELVRLADVGIANTTSGLLLPAASLPTEIATFAAVLIVLVVAEPVVAAVTLVYLGVLAAILYLVVNPRALVAGRVNRDYSFRVATLMTEMVATLKEIVLRDKTSEVADVVQANRKHAVRARSNSQFLGQAPKYVLEVALIFGFLLVGAIGYWMGGTTQAFTAVAIFGVAGFRMIPAITRMQAILTQTATTLPHAKRVIFDIRASEQFVRDAEVVGRAPIEGDPQKLTLEGVGFTYPGTIKPAVHDIDVTIGMGTHVALVGASGAGKSTLVDILLGLLVPQEGTMRVGDQELEDVLADWRSRVGYVPQDVSVFNGSIAQNVALAWDSAVDEERVRDCLARAQLLDIVEARGGLDTLAGERGMAFSGGQRQRLGIARALYTDPLVLVMDEATSALDTATEVAVTKALQELHGEVTVVTVAHRLSTIRHADLVCFMSDGTIAARGTFDEVVAQHPEFANQASLAGLA